MLVKTYCAAVNGLEVTTVTVEASLNTGVMYHLTGLGDEAVKESRNRIAAAMQYSGYRFPIADITINLASKTFLPATLLTYPVVSILARATSSRQG